MNTPQSCDSISCNASVIPVLDCRFPVANRYSKALVRSVPVLKSLVILSAVSPPTLWLLLSKDSFTDTNQPAIFSWRAFRTALENHFTKKPSWSSKFFNLFYMMYLQQYIHTAQNLGLVLFLFIYFPVRIHLCSKVVVVTLIMFKNTYFHKIASSTNVSNIDNKKKYLVE